MGFLILVGVVPLLLLLGPLLVAGVRGMCLALEIDVDHVALVGLAPDLQALGGPANLVVGPLAWTDTGWHVLEALAAVHEHLYLVRHRDRSAGVHSPNLLCLGEVDVVEIHHNEGLLLPPFRSNSLILRRDAADGD